MLCATDSAVLTVIPWDRIRLGLIVVQLPYGMPSENSCHSAETRGSTRSCARSRTRTVAITAAAPPATRSAIRTRRAAAMQLLLDGFGPIRHDDDGGRPR